MQPVFTLSKKAPKQVIARKWLGTLNNPDTTMAEDYIKGWVTTGGALYATGQLERGKEGTVHIQFFLYFGDKKQTLTALKKKCPKAHFEPVINDNGAADYCNKQDTRIEGPWSFGEPPLNPNQKGNMKKILERLERNMMITQNNLDDLVDQGLIAILQYPMLKRAKELYKADKALHTVKMLTGKLEEKNLWIFGKAGCGKTGYYRDYFNDNGGYYKKDKSKYWNGYEGQPNVIINDVELDDVHMLGLLKRWCEHEPFAAEDKYGGFTLIRPERIVVTSNYTPGQIFNKDGQSKHDLQPIVRRFTIMRFDFMMYKPEGHEDYNPANRARVYIPSISEQQRDETDLDQDGHPDV